MSIHQHPVAEGVTNIVSVGAVAAWVTGWHQHIEWLSGEAVLWLPILNSLAAGAGFVWIMLQIYHRITKGK